MAVFPFILFDNPLATNNTSAFDINDAGQIVGVYQDSRGEAHGFLLSGGTYTTLDVPSANPGFGTLAQGINDTGQIVGYFEDNNVGFHGFLHNLSSSTYTALDDPSSPPGSTEAYGINDAGQIVGHSGNHGFLAVPTGQGTYSYTTLNVPSAIGIGTIAQGINSSGQIVGYYRNGDPFGQQFDHGFLYNPNDGTYTTLDDPFARPDPFATVATGINDLGQIVGYFTDANGANMVSSTPWALSSL